MLATNQDNVEAVTPLPASQLPGTPLSGRATALALALILAVVFLAYIDTLWFQFVHDDDRVPDPGKHLAAVLEVSAPLFHCGRLGIRASGLSRHLLPARFFCSGSGCNTWLSD